MKKMRYKGDAKGTVFEVITANMASAPWTLIVCEDRPGLYSRFLAESVESGLVGKAMTVPFLNDTVTLLTEGKVEIRSTSLEIENLDQCVLVLDMDAQYAETDLLPVRDVAFVGGELFHRLDERMRDRTYLVSLRAPLDKEYYDRYPELTRIRIHPSLEEKKEDAASGGGTTLAEGTAELIRKFMRETKHNFDQPTFAPIVETRTVFETLEVSGGGNKKRRVKKDENGNAIREAQITKVSLAFAGSRPVDVKADPGAHYLFMMLQHPGKVLATSRMAAVANLGLIDEREDRIGFEKGADGSLESELPTNRGRTTETPIPDHAAVMDCCRNLTTMLNRSLEKSGRSAREAKLDGKRVLQLLADTDADASGIVKYIRSAHYVIEVSVDGDRWSVAAWRPEGQSDGARKRYPSSGAIRKAIDRFLQKEVQERLPRLYAHLKDSVKVSDDSATCMYKGNETWRLGDEPGWRVPLEHIVSQ